ncbi:hypothetical protein CN318_22195 [Bacillus cereus]|nr:hypothetical protein CN318_22195 [Bacillus cereus]
MEKLSKVFFIVDMKEEQKTGLFNATYNRIKNLSEYIDGYEIYTLREYDGKVLSTIKKIFHRKINIKLKKSYIYGGDEIKYFYTKNTLLTVLLKKIGVYYPLFTALKMKKLVKGYQLICAHWGHPQGSVAKLLSKFVKIPYTITYHGSDIHSIPFKSRKNFNDIKRNLQDANLNIFVSESLKKISIESLNNDNSNNIVIPNGIDLSKYYKIQKNESFQLKKEIGITGKVVGFVGNLYEVKRADKLPEIFKQIQMQSVDNIEFIVIGEGELRSNIEKKCKEYQLSVFFTGKLEPKEVNQYMNIIDVLILPSRREAFGLVILEANATGTIALGSDVGGIPEAIGDPNFIVKDDNNFEKYLAQKVIYYLKNDYDSELLIERVKSTYDLSVLAKIEYTSLLEVLKNSMKYSR